MEQDNSKKRKILLPKKIEQPGDRYEDADTQVNSSTGKATIEDKFSDNQENDRGSGKVISNNGFVSIADADNLREDDSNFVFFFGKASIGKTVILASMLYYMNTSAGSINPKNSTPNTKEAEVLLFDLLDGLRRGNLPTRTQKDVVTKLNLIFRPNNKSKKIIPIDLTFLEISGDNHFEVRRGGKYHRSIEEYLTADMPLNFILVTDYDNASDDDSLMFSFLNELKKKGKDLQYANIILVISKWDKSGSMSVQNPEELNYFIRQNMPMTNNQIDSYSHYRTLYTIGDIENKNGMEKISRLNLNTAKVLTEWLYKSITKVDLNYEGTFWERVFGK